MDWGADGIGRQLACPSTPCLSQLAQGRFSVVEQFHGAVDLIFKGGTPQPQFLEVPTMIADLFINCASIHAKSISQSQNSCAAKQ